MTRTTLLSTTLIGGIVFAALPAMAQDLCAGAGAGGQWIAGDEASSDISAAGDYQEQMALVMGGNDYVALFSLSEPTNVRIESQGRGAGDPLLDVFGADGNIIISDDDSGGNGAARAEVSLDPGTYCVATRSYDGSPMTAFVRIGRTDEHEPLTEGLDLGGGGGGYDGSCAEATPMGTLDGALSHVAPTEEAPYLSFTLEQAMPVTVTATNESADPVVTLYDSNDGYLGENDDFDGLNSRLDMVDPLPAGEYCIALDALSDSSAPVTVEVTEYDPVAALAALVDRGEASPPMDGSVQIAELGVLQNRIRHDAQASDTATWMSFEMPESGVALIEAIAASSSGDTWLVVFDDLGRQVALNDDNGESYDSLVAARLDRGTYVVGLRDISGNPGFARMVFERYVPAK